MSESSSRECWVGPDELAAQIGVSRRCVYNWLRDGKLRYARVVGGPIRIDPASAWADYTGERNQWMVNPTRSEAARKSAAKGQRARAARVA